MAKQKRSTGVIDSGCVTPQERAARAFRAAADTCTSIGIPEGHKDRWDCEVRAADMIERDRVHATGVLALRISC